MVVLENFDLRGVTNKPNPEKGTGGALPTDKQRFIASVSELRLAIKNSCNREMTEVLIVDSIDSTIECHFCGHKEKYDASKQINRTCPKCKTLWDQDYNASVVLLRRGLREKSLKFYLRK